MAKISKNAKKLLALTLAGVMTVGTAVPGTVVSTVQEAQAADEVSFASAQEALNYLKKAFSDKYPTTVFVLAGEKYQPVVEDELKDAVDSIEKAGYTVTFGAVPSQDEDVHTGTTVTVEKDTDNVAETFNFPVEVYDADRIAEEFLGATDTKIDLSDVEITEETSKATVKKLVEEKVTAELDGFARKDNVTVSATVTDPVTDADVKSFDVDVTINAGTSAYTVSGTVSTEVAHVATDSEKAAEIVEKSSLVAVVPDNVSIDASATVSNTINKKVAEAAKKAIMADEQFADRETDISVTWKKNVNSMIGYGAWHGVLQITVGNAGTVEVELDATVVHESDAEEKTVINLELLEAQDEIEVDTGFETAVTGMKIYFEDGTSKELASSDFATGKNTYFTYNKNAFSSEKLGTTSVEFKSLNSVNPVTVTYTANVVYTQEYSNFKEMTDAVTEDKISSLTSSDENVITIVTDKDKKEWSFKAVGAGKATVTVVAKDGSTYTSEVTVEEDGNMTFAAAKYLKTESYITSDSYGLIADKVTSQSQSPANWKDDVVAKAEVVDLNGTNAVKITPVANGEASFKVSGGDNGKLTNTITVKVEDTGITVTEGAKNFDTLVLNQKTQDALLSRAYSESDLNGKDEITLNVADFDFPSDAKLVLKNGSKEIDTVSADEITGITLKKENGKLNLVVNYCDTFTTIKNVAAVVNAKSVENTITELGLVADSIKSVEKPDHNEYIQAELTKNASGQSIVYITPGEDLTATTDATVKVVVEDAEGNTAEITVTITDGKIAAAKPTKFKGYTGYTVNATEAGKIVYTLGDAVSYDGIYLVSKDGKDKVAVTDKMVTDYTTSKTASPDKTGALAEETAIVNYGGSNGTFTYYVKPALATVDVDSLGLASGEKVTNVTWKGDSTISASLTDDKTAIEIMATKTEQSGSVLVTTNKGNTVNVKVSVDANGDIETSTNNYFESSMTVVDNTIENLGVVGTSATSSNTDVAIVKLAGNRVVITSVGVGTAEITVTDGNSSAIIPVTVDEFGTITIGDIQTAVEDGFVRGEGSDWYYYINGKKVTNDWVAVEEADPYNNNEVGTVWYHFDKDGKMQRGWIKDETGWKIYNLDSNGRMRHDMWINAEANEELGMPTGIYHLLSDGAAQMNGWAESVTEGIYWFCAPNSGVFDASNPANWATSMPK